MKKIIFLLCIFFLASCSAPQDPIYSCDPDINKWAVDNLDHLKTMTRTDFAALEGEYQKAAFRVFSPIQKKSIWREKLEETISLERWDSKEKVHIQSLLTIMQNYPDLYDENISQSIRDKIELAFFRWESIAADSLNWSDELIYRLAYSPAPVEDGISAISEANGNNSIPFDVGPTLRCNCNTRYKECRVYTHSCKPGNCESTSSGCGQLMWSNCDGRCEEQKIKVCDGTACHLAGSEYIYREFEKYKDSHKISLEKVRCIGACSIAPVVVKGETVFSRVTVDDVEMIVKFEYNN